MKIRKRFAAVIFVALSFSLLSFGAAKKDKKTKKNKTKAATEQTETSEVKDSNSDADVQNTAEKTSEGDAGALNEAGAEVGGEALAEQTAEGSSVGTVGVSADEAAAEGADGEEAKREESNKNYTGWIEAAKRSLEFKNGIIKIKTKPRMGTYNISFLSDTGKYVPVLATSNEYTSSPFFLKVDKKIYKLCCDANIKTSARTTDSGIELYYNIPNVAEVVVGFSTFASVNKGDADMIKVTVNVTNSGKRKNSFSAKTLLDTVLGESTSVHFYTDSDLPVTNELMYRGVSESKFFVSKNNYGKMTLFVSGRDVSPIDIVALGSYTTLDIKNWEPEMMSYRVFDNVLSYNNSAIEIAWPKKTLAPEESVSFIYYMGFSPESKSDDCENYMFPEESAVIPVSNDSALIKPVEAAKPVEVIGTAPAVQTITDTGVTPASPAVAPLNVEPEPPKNVPPVKFDVSKLSKEQLTPEYIQNLLDRIAALEENDTSLNREEILQLNAELDAILEVLRM